MQRYKDLFQKLDYKTILLNGVLWTEYQKMIVPVGPVFDKYEIPYAKQRADLLRFFKECVLMRAGGGFIDTPNAWYAVVCDRPFDLADLSANTRSKVRRGLKNCVVRRIDVKFMAEHAWSVFFSGVKRYKNDWLRVSEGQFRESIIATEGFEDIIHYWGVFERGTGKFIAFVKNYLYDRTEINYWTIRFHHDFLSLYSSYALFYEMNRYYLDGEKFEYVNAGFRSLLHETNIQEYLTEKFLFKKQPVGLEIFYRPFIGRCMSLTYPYRSLLGKLYQPLAALYKLEEINRA
ncbi:MAG: hypothetical protein PHE15_02185 [Dehalococcoidales bacterium]|nr:hypothetical protein [Dehalococcoidales bacterium]